jgi:hypothetical protein
VPELFNIDVRGLEHLHGTDRKIVFHGVNKSGSLVLTNVLFHGYHDADRANQFFSTYRKVPVELEQLRSIIEHSTGHGFFGAHYLYGSVSLRPGEHLLTSQFRNPLPRVRSVYQWLKNKGEVGGATFEDWVAGTRGVRHSQVQQFGRGFGPGVENQLASASAEELLDRAVTNIERDVAWFGIAEYLEESAFTMAALCGLPAIRAWESDDRNAGRPLVEDWPPGHAEVVREVFRCDFLLYEWALERFRRQVSALEIGPELERYRLACAGAYKDRLAPDGTPAQPLAGETPSDQAVARETIALMRARTAAAEAAAESARDEIDRLKATNRRLRRRLRGHAGGRPRAGRVRPRSRWGALRRRLGP